MPTTERTHEQIREDLGIANARYLELQSGPESEWRPYSNQVKALQEELRLKLAEGAEACPTCGGQPIGLRHIRVIPGQNLQFATYEVGCPNCRDHRAAGATQEDAAANFNAGPDKWIVPTALLDAIKGYGLVCADGSTPLGGLRFREKRLSYMIRKAEGDEVAEGFTPADAVDFWNAMPNHQLPNNIRERLLQKEAKEE